MIVVYVAGKYTDMAQYKVKKNIWRAEELGMEIVRRFGSQHVMVIVPHTNTAHWEGIQSDEWFYEATEELLRRSDACIYIPGDLEKSRGTKQEYDHCVKNNKPVFCGDEAGLVEFGNWIIQQNENKYGSPLD